MIAYCIEIEKNCSYLYLRIIIDSVPLLGTFSRFMTSDKFDCQEFKRFYLSSLPCVAVDLEVWVVFFIKECTAGIKDHKYKAADRQLKKNTIK